MNLHYITIIISTRFHHV